MKQKHIRNHLYDELDFVSTLELEQAIDIITVLADTYPVTLTERHPDRVDFEVKYTQGKLKGALQRWRGNETRVTCTGDVVRIAVEDHQHKEISIAPLITVVGGLAFISLLGAGQVIPALMGAGVLLSLGLNQKTEVKKQEPDTILLFRERDAIYQYIIDGFKASGEVSLR